MKLHILTGMIILVLLANVGFHLSTPYLIKRFCNPVIILEKTPAVDKFFYKLDMNGEVRYLWTSKDQPVGSVVCYPYK